MNFIGFVLLSYAVFVSVFYTFLPGLTHRPLSRPQITLLALALPAGVAGAYMSGIETYELEWIFLLPFLYALLSLHHLWRTEELARRREELPDEIREFLEEE